MSEDDESSSSSSSESEVEEKVVVAKKPVKKKKEPPTGPKKPLSAYMFFCKARRSVLKSENPGSSFCDLGKKLGEEWKEMAAPDREEYTELADKDKVRYTDEGGGGRKRKKKTGGPKRPLSAYMFFSKEARPQIKAEKPEMGFADLGKEIGLRWKALDDKSKFNEFAEEDKLRYRKELSEGVGDEEPVAKPPPAKKAKAVAPPPPPVEENDGGDDDDDDDDAGSGSDSADSEST